MLSPYCFLTSASDSNSLLAGRTAVPLEGLEACPGAAGVPYKAVIQVMLNGGLDSFSVLVPDSCTGTNAEGTTVDQQYRDVRGPLAFDRSKGEYDLTITPNSEQPCESFAIHEDLPFVKELYDDGDLLFFANVGVVNNNKMNRENWEDKTRARLFSHSSMQQEAIKLDTYEKLPGSGVLGRLNDMLINKFNGTANSIGISDNSNTLSIRVRGPLCMAAQQEGGISLILAFVGLASFLELLEIQKAIL